MLTGAGEEEDDDDDLLSDGLTGLSLALGLFERFLGMI